MAGGVDNLLQNQGLSKEEIKAANAKGGRKSGETRRRQKQMKEIFNTLLQMKTKDGRAVNLEKVKSISDLQGVSMTVEERICLKQVLDAADGSLPAAVFIRDTIGERPTERLEVTQDIAEAADKIQRILVEGKREE